jgi:hypothetical protein
MAVALEPGLAVLSLSIIQMNSEKAADRLLSMVNFFPNPIMPYQEQVALPQLETELELEMPFL